jgi:putative peptide zinc metalloprotease protein
VRQADSGKAAASRYAALTVVREGDGYVLGAPAAEDFVAVPEIGGQVVLWLQDGIAPEECAERAAELAGEPVDVTGFIDGLAEAGLLAPDDTAELAQWKRTAGRLVFGRAGLIAASLLTLTAAVALVGFPRVRPGYQDAITTGIPLVTIVSVAGLGIALGLAHEFAHVLAAWAAGVPSRISISRRMITIVYQTDLTRLWSVPRRSRIVPLLAGLLFDGATIGVLAVIELTLPAGPATVAHLIRAAVLLNISAIGFQFLIFLRTDVYALFVLATGCKHLWATKGAAARRAIGRATAEDLELLGSVSRREIGWARVFLCLYLPGVVFTAWYFVVFALPAVRRIITMSATAAFSGSAPLAASVAGGIALLITTASFGYILWGLARTTVRIVRQLSRR